MSTNTNIYGSNIHSNEFIVLPISALDIPINTTLFNNGSIRDHETSNATRKIMYTTDGLYAFYGMEMSDLKNDTKDFKTFTKLAGLNLGTDDFTAIVGDEFWVLNAKELGEWLSISPHNQEIV